MMYDNFIKSLEKLHIKPIESIGLEPDAQFHEPVSMQPVEDKNLDEGEIMIYAGSILINNFIETSFK